MIVGYDDEELIRIDYLIRKILDAFEINIEEKVIILLSSIKVVGTCTRENLI